MIQLIDSYGLVKRICKRDKPNGSTRASLTLRSAEGLSSPDEKSFQCCSFAAGCAAAAANWLEAVVFEGLLFS